MPNHLRFEQWVPYPLEQVFEFFSNPENLPRIMPAASSTRLVLLKREPPPPIVPTMPTRKAAGVGSVIVTTFRVFPLLPIRAKWIARITEFEWNHHFADVQDKGPFKSWHHRHEFAGDIRDGINGTTVRDVIEYQVGLGVLGNIANLLFVRRQMEETFSQRQHTLPKLLKGEPSQ
jgi:ligand-binding SRPBCC domain-containing protein